MEGGRLWGPSSSSTPPQRHVLARPRRPQWIPSLGGARVPRASSSLSEQADGPVPGLASKGEPQASGSIKISSVVASARKVVAAQLCSLQVRPRNAVFQALQPYHVKRQSSIAFHFFLERPSSPFAGVCLGTRSCSAVFSQKDKGANQRARLSCGMEPPRPRPYIWGRAVAYHEKRNEADFPDRCRFWPEFPGPNTTPNSSRSRSRGEGEGGSIASSASHAHR